MSEPVIDSIRAAATAAEATIVEVKKGREDALALLAQARANDAADLKQITDLKVLVTEMQDRIDDLEDELEGYDPETPSVLGMSLGTVLPSNVTQIDHSRIYMTPGGISARWNAKSTIVQAMALGCFSFHISYKDADQNKIDAFLKTVPENIKPFVRNTYFHEHDGDIRKGSLSLAAYKAGGDAVADVVHDNGMLYGPCHNGNVFSPTKGWGFWPEIWASMESDTSKYDFWSLDGYCDDWQDVDARFAGAITYAQDLGVPLGVGELASPAGPKQAAWAESARQLALDEFDFSSWWHQQFAGKPDYRLSNASAAAWLGL